MLTADQLARVNAALAVAKKNADEADALVPGFLDGLWASVIGASSSADALNANAAATRELLATLTAKAASWQTSPGSVNDAAVADFERSASATDNAAAREGAALLTPSAAARETFVPANGPGLWPPSAWPSWLVGVVLVVLVVSVAPAILARLVRGRR